jgi:hypothetical protein
VDPSLKVSNAARAAKRSQVVQLADWSTVDGEPLRVLCTEIEAERALEITGTPPGDQPRLGIRDGADADEQLAATKRVLQFSADLIELGTSLEDDAGAEVRPAFYFSGPRPHPLSLDGRKLSDGDLMLLSVAILRCCGHLGGAAEASFLREERIRAEARGPALEVLPGGRADASGGAPRS